MKAGSNGREQKIHLCFKAEVDLTVYGNNVVCQRVGDFTVWPFIIKLLKRTSLTPPLI